MSKSSKVLTWVHAALLLAGGVLTVVSSALAYKLDALTVVLALLGGALLLDGVSALALSKPGVLMDVVRWSVVVLTTVALCMVFTGRADLMGYLWFSDLEKGNATAIAALNTGCAAMACMGAGMVMDIVRAFRRDR